MVGHLAHHRVLSGVALGLWLAASGCSSLREIPRSDFGSLPERRGVRVETREGLVYDFDYATFSGDSLTGYRNRSEVEGPAEQTAVFRIALDEVDHLTARRLDWYRTGLVGGGVLAGVLVAGLGSQAVRGGGNGGNSGGGGGRGF